MSRLPEGGSPARRRYRVGDRGLYLRGAGLPLLGLRRGFPARGREPTDDSSRAAPRDLGAAAQAAAQTLAERARDGLADSDGYRAQPSSAGRRNGARLEGGEEDHHRAGPLADTGVQLLVWGGIRRRFRFRDARGRRAAVPSDQQEREGRGDDAHSAPTGEFQEHRESDEESHDAADEGETLPRPPRISRRAADEQHRGDEDERAFPDRDDRVHAERGTAAVDQEGAADEGESRDGVDARGPRRPGREAVPEPCGVVLRGPGEERDRRERAEEMPDGGPIRRQDEIDEDRRGREEADRGDVSAPGRERDAPRARPDPVDEEDRHRDAHDRVVDRQPNGPDPVHVEPAAVPPEGPEVHPRRIEERLDREAFLDDPVRRAEEKDPGPADLPADRRLAHY